MDGNRIFGRPYPEDDDYMLPAKRPPRIQKKLIALHQLIQPDFSAVIIKNLFAGNEAEFHSFIQILQDLSTWESAMNIIEEELDRRGISQYSNAAHRFTNLVYRRYYPEDEYVKIRP